MCDFSLEHTASRAAKRGDRLMTHRFPSSTTGLVEPGHVETAVCLRPGTELAFDEPIQIVARGFIGGTGETLASKTAIFTQIEIARSRPDGTPLEHRDAIALPNGEVFKLQELSLGQHLHVLQVPAEVTIGEAVAEVSKELENAGS